MGCNEVQIAGDVIVDYNETLNGALISQGELPFSVKNVSN